MSNMRIDDYQSVMQRLYNAASKYPDQNLAKAISEVRDLMVYYRNQLIYYTDQQPAAGAYTVTFTKDKVEVIQRMLADNGVDQTETDTVAEAIGGILGVDIGDLIDWM